MIGGKGRRDKGSITVTHINEALENDKDAMYAAVLGGDDLKNTFKNKKKQKKIESKANKKMGKVKKKVFWFRPPPPKKKHKDKRRGQFSQFKMLNLKS